MKQFIITPAAGKRLIAKAAMKHHAVQAAFRSGTVVIVAGTTNGYVAEEILKEIGQSDGFIRRRFFRGVTLYDNCAQCKSFACESLTEIFSFSDEPKNNLIPLIMRLT